jgi:hypothetical protein
VDDQPSTLWSLELGGRHLLCQAKLVSYGIEIHLAYDGETTVTRVFETGEEALAWAAKKRVDREAAGWKAPAG